MRDQRAPHCIPSPPAPYLPPDPSPRKWTRRGERRGKNTRTRSTLRPGGWQAGLNQQLLGRGGAGWAKDAVTGAGRRKLTEGWVDASQLPMCLRGSRVGDWEVPFQRPDPPPYRPPPPARTLDGRIAPAVP